MCSQTRVPWSSCTSVGHQSSFLARVALIWLESTSKGASDFFSGFGETLTFGLTRKIRQWMGVDYVVNTCSGFYAGGKVTAIVHSILLGAAGGLEAAGAETTETEFSHWIPDRVLKRTGSTWLRRTFGRSIFNGNYVTPARHALHDAFRFTGGATEKLPLVIGQLDRVPRVYYGTAAGVAAGTAEAETSGACGCH